MDTKTTWRIWTLMIYLLVALVITALTYLVGGEHLKNIASQAYHFILKDRTPKPIAFPSSDRIYTDDLVYARGITAVRGACLSCHSSQLITQNRATRDGWDQMITWMQKTQGLPELGKQRNIILDYLSTNYHPIESGRRRILNQEEIDWYNLDPKEVVAE